MPQYTSEIPPRYHIGKREVALAVLNINHYRWYIISKYPAKKDLSPEYLCFRSLASFMSPVSFRSLATFTSLTTFGSLATLTSQASFMSPPTFTSLTTFGSLSSFGSLATSTSLATFIRHVATLIRQCPKLSQRPTSSKRHKCNQRP